MIITASGKNEGEAMMMLLLSPIIIIMLSLLSSIGVGSRSAQAEKLVAKASLIRASSGASTRGAFHENGIDDFI